MDKQWTININKFLLSNYFEDSQSETNGRETTQEEIDAYNIIKAILRKNIDVSRITMRGTKSYCGILLDDNNRKPICRLRFNHSRKYLGLFSDKNEEKIETKSIDEIFKYAERIETAIQADTE